MEEERIPLQISQELQGSPSTCDTQLTALAKIFAVEVFPVPLPPQKR